jgi:hypothetical protein
MIYQVAVQILTQQTSTVAVVVVSYCLDGRNILTCMFAPEEDAPPGIYQAVAAQTILTQQHTYIFLVARNRISTVAPEENVFQ